VVNEPGNERKILTSLTGSYLYKDIFTFQDIRKPEIIESLLEALALQAGNEVSYHELANTLGIWNQPPAALCVPSFSPSRRNHI
jgi:predicted AAA+ superfamily ATPase